MSASEVDLFIDQGADWALQLFWLSGENLPYPVTGPMRMEIRNEVGGVVATLQTSEHSTDLDTDPDSQSILYNSESGLIQLQISSEQTDRLADGQYRYDLFVHYADSVTGVVRKKMLIRGTVTVQRRYTKNV